MALIQVNIPDHLRARLGKAVADDDHAIGEWIGKIVGAHMELLSQGDDGALIREGLASGFLGREESEQLLQSLLRAEH